MSLSERLSNAKPRKSGIPCGVEKVISSLSGDDLTAFESVMFDVPRRISNHQLRQILIEEGYDVSYTSVAQHRRMQCRCFIGRGVKSVSIGSDTHV